jgi:hypothetical protein
MTRKKAFETAASRRRANPIEWEVDGVIIKLKATMELTDIADLYDELQAPTPEGINEMVSADMKRKTLVNIVKMFVEEVSLPYFEKVEKDLDAGILAEMMQELVTEYTGQANPTEG